MSEEYLKSAREAGAANSNVTEAELMITREEIRESWEALEQVRLKIYQAKIDAVTDVDARFHDELKDAEANYAMLLQLSR